MKKALVAIVFLALLADLGLMAFFIVQQQKQISSLTKTIAENDAAEQGMMMKEQEIIAYTYTNSKYGFSLVFPENWGKTQEKINPGLEETKILESIVLTSNREAEREIEIYVVLPEDRYDPTITDLPATFLGASLNYDFYYSGSGDNAGKPGLEDQKYFDILEETQEIANSFTLVR